MRVTAESIPRYLRKPICSQEVAARIAVPGLATGLAWAPTGGEIPFIKARRVRGRNRFTLARQFGEVMRELAQAASSYVWSRAESLDINEGALEQTDIHLHIPSGAIRQDGPSDGVAMVTALASPMRNEPRKSRLAMTAESILSGQVLPTGGIEEKLLAAYHTGVGTVCLPHRNEQDLEALPDEIREEINIILIDRMEQVFELIFKDLQRNKRVKKRKNKTGPEGFGKDAVAEG